MGSGVSMILVVHPELELEDEMAGGDCSNTTRKVAAEVINSARTSQIIAFTLKLSASLVESTGPERMNDKKKPKRL
jgi:hypothetical protein